MFADSQRLYSYLNILPIGCAIFRVTLDASGAPQDLQYMFANRKYCDWIEKNQQTIAGHSLYDIVSDASTDWLELSYRTAYEGKEQCLTRYSMVLDRWLETYITPAEDGCCIHTYLDVTHEKRFEEQLHLHERDDFVLHCAQVLNSAKEPNAAVQHVLGEIGMRIGADRVYILETNHIVVNNTYEWCKPGITPEKDELQNIPYSIMAHWEERVRRHGLVLVENVNAIKNTSPDEFEILSMQGIKCLMAVPLYDDSNTIGYVGADNYDKNKLEEAPKLLSSVAYFLASHLNRSTLIHRLSELSYHDTLTNALNRTAFTRMLREQQEGFGDVGVLYIDINGLKLINDTRGHNEGDAMICAMHALLTDVFPSYSIYRMGGDEYIVLMNHISKEAFDERLEHLHEKALQLPGLAFACGHCWQAGKVDVQTVLTKADEDMYEDKRRFYVNAAIKNRRYRPHLDDCFGFTDSEVFHDLLKNKSITFYLQPKVCSVSGRICGAEALVRYVRDNGEVVSAGEFIPLLETTHFISDLDFYVFKSVCIQIKNWLDMGIVPMRIAINFSRLTLSRPDFTSEINRLWSSCPAPKEYLEIEITETTISDSMDMLKNTVAALHRDGFTVTLDDFGVAESNLSSITEMDFDLIKIDKSIVSTMQHTQKNAILFTGIVRICHEMGVRVVAEGVESAEQVQLLTDMGVDELQGFYYSPAVPVEDFMERYMQCGFNKKNVH